MIPEELKKTIVITGSTRGIGFGLAKEFAKRSCQLVLNGRSEKNLAIAIEKIKDIYPDVTGLVGSVSDEATHLALVEKANLAFGKIDIWINNAGVPQPHEKIVDVETCHIKQLTEVNIAGSIIGSKVAANAMIRQDYGKIFNLEGFGSDGRMMDKITLYGTTKRAINYFTKSLAKELKGSAVQVGIIQPGMVRTEFLKVSMDSASESEKKRFEKVQRILAEDVDVVTKALAPRILEANKDYDRIEFLSGLRLAGKIFRMVITR